MLKLREYEQISQRLLYGGSGLELLVECFSGHPYLMAHPTLLTLGKAGHVTNCDPWEECGREALSEIVLCPGDSFRERQFS